ncbi:MAG: TM2 domain-containing protein [Clostridium sp.]|uniref:TM2 domain-containing protein n=1 Tax=Clostridium sp. TaxID=1506 RepID=UPI002910DE4C|nr:TM2 domain-containing protein [Clostridium sp.]MDU5108881.1 TM2 domain-containing protein [Clostridium sp.]
MRNNYKIEFFLCLFLGYFGVHKFYEKKIGKGVLYFFTVGLFGFGWIYDCIVLFGLAFLTNEASLKKREEALKEKEIIKQEQQLIKQQEREITYNEYVQAREERKNNKEVCCPRCGSTSLSANKKGWSLGKGIAGAVLINPIGGVATGMIGKNKIIITCLKCGKQFKPGR